MTYAVGDTGPGGGLVFLISGGKTYEMAPKNWDDPNSVSAVDPAVADCRGSNAEFANQMTSIRGPLGSKLQALMHRLLLGWVARTPMRLLPE